jgi:hypothetical protein
MGLLAPVVMFLVVAFLFYLVRDTSALLRLVTGAFLILHGLVHLGAAVGPRPGASREWLWAFFTTGSWLQRGQGPQAVRPVGGIALFVLATVGFVLAGLVELIGLGAWRVLAVGSALDSLLLLILSWHRLLEVGVLLNVAILVALLWARWPPAELVGS